ncbi:MAG: DUF2332 domain-containing protein [Acidimicrobiia bacterium]
MTKYQIQKESLADYWRFFAETECKGYSPLYEAITTACANSDDVMEFVTSLPSHAHQPNLLLAAMHERVLLGHEPELSVLYADNQVRGVGVVFVEAVLKARDRLQPILSTRFTQTNEIGRVAIIAPALAAISSRDNFTLIDVGTSAGLTLRLDDCFIDYGSHGSLGPHDSKVRVKSDVLSGNPPRQSMPIGRRIGIDRNILNPANEDDARWLLACVWPDTGRLDRTRAAIELAASRPSELIEGDALETLSDLLTSVQGPIVVTTTWVVAYMDIEYRARLSAELMAASQQRDIYWISAEAPGVVSDLPEVLPPQVEGPLPSVVGLVTFTKGEIVDARVLAHAHSHGSWIWWYDR